MAEATIHGLKFQVEGSADPAVAALQKLADTFAKVKSAGKNLGLSNAKSELKSLGSTAARTASTLSKLGAAFKRIVFYRGIRSAIKAITDGFKEGLKNAYEFSRATGDHSGLAAALDTLATKSLTMKNQLGAAFGGLLTTITPIVVQIIGLVTKLAEAISRLFAMLGGNSTYLRAKDVWTEWGEAAAGAGGEAKKALEYLAPFDELNVLPDPKSGGGGGAAANIGDMFDYADLSEWEQQLMHNLEDFKASFKIAFDDVFFDWSDLSGEQITEKVIAALGGILGAGVGFIIGGVPGAIVGTLIGVSLGLSFDALVFNHDGQLSDSEIKTSLVTALNTITGGMFGFVVGGPAGALIGASIGFGLSLLVKSIDLLPNSAGLDSNSLLSDLATCMVVLTGATIGFGLGGPGGALLGATISLGLTLAVGQIDFSFGQNEGGKPWWQRLADWIAEGINDFFDEISYMFTGMSAFDFGLSMDEWAENANEVINGFLNGIADGLNGAVQWVKEHVWNPLIKAIKNVFGIASPAKNMKPYGENIAEGIKEGIKNVFANIKQWVSDNILKPIQNAINTAKEKIKVGIQLIKDGWTTVTAWVNNSAQKGKDAVNKGIGLVRNGWTYVSTWIKEKFMGKYNPEKGINIIRNGWTTVTAWIKEKFMGKYNPEKGINIIRNGWTYVSSWIKDKWMGSSTPEKGISIVRKGWEYVSSWITGKWMGASTPEKGIGIVRKGWEYISTWIKDKWMGASTPEKGVGIFRQGWDYISDWIKNNWMGNASTDQGVGLWKNGWNTVTSWVANAVTGTVSQDTMLSIIGSKVADRLSYYGSFLADAYLNIVGQTNTPTIYANVEASAVGRTHGGGGSVWTAKGGAFYGGNWHDIPQAASGGLFHGSLFWAGEAGPELVGHAGGRTEVLNRSQIAATMYASIRSAMSGVGVRVSAPSSDSYGENEDVVYRAIVRALTDTGVDGDIELDGDVLYRKMVQYNRKNTRLTGVNAMA